MQITQSSFVDVGIRRQKECPSYQVSIGIGILLFLTKLDAVVFNGQDGCGQMASQINRNEEN